MKTGYYRLIQDRGINDVLYLIPEIPYSKKINILKELIKNFPVDVINRSLDTYKTEYIDLNRVLIYKLKNVLIYYCRRYNVH